MRFLVLDHFFAQDIQALQGAGSEDEWEAISYELLRAEALRVLPPQVASGFEAFANPELQGARERYATVLREILEDRFTRFPFDALVLPSDTFFYVRAAPAVAHALGVPLLVVQKETTVSEQSLRTHAERMRRYAPPLADRMTVCSERHKGFWLRAGGEDERIEVTGQPRFDFYAERSRAPAAAGKDPSVLFLSYATDAYHPDEGRGEPAWERLHRETEQGLQELARRGWRVLIKPHPQQPADQLEAWRRRAGELWASRLVPIPPDADVRPLIIGVDAIVGFQSTAMLEAMIAGRPVLYTGWDPQAAALDALLIPFHRWEGAVTVLRTPGELPDAVVAARGARCSEATTRTRREIAERYLGPLDGRASARAVAILRAEAQRWQARRSEPERELRRRLAGRRPPLRLARRGRAFRRAARRRLGAALGR